MRYPDNYYNSIKAVIENIPDKDKLKGKSILVTGATGLIGSAVCDVLVSLNREEKYEMHLLFAGRNKEALEKRFHHECTHPWRQLLPVPVSARHSTRLYSHICFPQTVISAG